MMTQSLLSNETVGASGASLVDTLALHAYAELFLDEGAGAQQHVGTEQEDWWRRKRHHHFDWGRRGKQGWS